MSDSDAPAAKRPCNEPWNLPEDEESEDEETEDEQSEDVVDLS